MRRAEVIARLSKERVTRWKQAMRKKRVTHEERVAHKERLTRTERVTSLRKNSWVTHTSHLISSKAELGEKQATCTSLFKWIDPGMVVVNTPRSDLHTMQSYLTSQMAHRAKAYLSFCRVKRLGALPPHPVFLSGFLGGSLLTIYPHRWREVLGKSVVPKNTITRPASSMLTVGHLPQGEERKLTNQPVCVNKSSTEFINPYHFAIRELNVLNELSCNRIPETFRSLCLSNKHASNLWNNKSNK